MEWQESAENGVVIVRLEGEIDLHYSPRLRDLLQTKVDSRIPALLLDFSGVQYIDSSGLATLVEYYQQSRSYSGRIAIAGLNSRVKSIFDLVRLNEIFSFYDTPDEARRELGGG